MYKTASANLQHALSALYLPDLQSDGLENLPMEEQRANLVRRLIGMEGELASAPKGSRARLALIQQKRELEEKMLAIRVKTRAHVTDQYFIDAAKEHLTRAMFQIIMADAAKRMRLDELKAAPAAE